MCYDLQKELTKPIKADLGMVNKLLICDKVMEFIQSDIPEEQKKGILKLWLYIDSLLEHRDEEK